MPRNWSFLFGRLAIDRKSLRRGSRLTVESLEARTLLTTFLVDDDAPGCNAAGPVYCEIQDAVDDAQSGDTIRVAAGTYDPVVVNTNNITIREANNNSNPVVDATPPIPTDQSVGVTLSADRVTIKGLAVQNANGPGFDVIGNNNLLRDNSATGNNFAGFKVSGDNNALWDNGATSNPNFGFYVSGDNNTLWANRSSNNGWGFYVIENTNNTLTANTATGNLFDGFVLDNATGNTLMLNTASGNGGAGFFVQDFDLDNTAGNTLTRNTANGNGGQGFLLQDNNNTLSRNIARQNVGYGFDDDGSGNVFVNNRCNGNTAGPSDPSGIC